jgi:hypothetical protein
MEHPSVPNALTPSEPFEEMDQGRVHLGLVDWRLSQTIHFAHGLDLIHYLLPQVQKNSLHFFCITSSSWLVLGMDDNSFIQWTDKIDRGFP